MNFTGGCLCGNIRYSINLEPVDIGFCHCLICQKSSGAPVLAWVTVPVSQFSYLQGDVKVFQSSKNSHREHCPVCGTQLVFRGLMNRDTIDVTLSSFDDNSTLRPNYHIWTQSKPVWLQIGDELPKYEDSGPDWL